MTDEKAETDFLAKKMAIASDPVKRSFSEVRNQIENRIEWRCLRPEQRAPGRELAMIIAEVELLPPEALVRIDGNDLPAGLVSEIYRTLTHDHIIMVLDSLAATNYRIRSVKTYIRTALYNAAFTLENYYTNAAQSDL